jgi:hypothetical protein
MLLLAWTLPLYGGKVSFTTVGPRRFGGRGTISAECAATRSRVLVYVGTVRGMGGGGSGGSAINTVESLRGTVVPTEDYTLMLLLINPPQQGLVCDPQSVFTSLYTIEGGLLAARNAGYQERNVGLTPCGVLTLPY